VTVPVRDVVAVLAATDSETVPLPVPEPPEVTVIHEAPLDEVQLQPLVPLTFTVNGPPVDVAEVDVGETVKLHGAPAWLTVKVFPPAVIVAERAVPAVFAAAEYPIEPLPEPDPPLVTASQEALLLAVHVQPVCAVIATVDEAPVEAAEAEVGESA
jgi:hypothetical protein